MSKELTEDEFSRLVRKIDESDEELKNLACKNDTLAMENGKLQEQISEANEVIKKYMALGNWYDFYNEGPGMVADDMQKYLLKWGVK